MAEHVKRTRRYDSSRRRAQAAATRTEILDAARRQFERRGYAATTMEAIAAEAGVALKTVYVGFETKSGLLRALWTPLPRAGRDETPVAEQQWYRDMVRGTRSRASAAAPRAQRRASTSSGSPASWRSSGAPRRPTPRSGRSGS